jgi:AraC-like DNA-binding protein
LIHEHLRLWLYAAEETAYEQLKLPQRRLDCWVVSYVKLGDVTVTAPDGRVRARTGNVMVHPPNQFFGEHASTPGVHQWFLLDAKDGSGLELLRHRPLPRVLYLDAPGAFDVRFATLEQLWREDTSPLREVRVAHALLELLLLLFDNLKEEAKDAPLHKLGDRFERVVQYMRSRLHEPLSRRDFAREAHLHPTHFDRAFRNIYGVAPMQMLRELRLRQVRQQLETTGDTLATIADACGFNDAAYLSRTFKARFGQTPGDYRERVNRTKRSYITVLQGSEPMLNNNT